MAETTIKAERLNPETSMESGKIKKNRDGADKTLIAMFLKLTPEERIRSNDNAVNAVRELQNAFKQRRKSNNRPECSD